MDAAQDGPARGGPAQQGPTRHLVLLRHAESAWPDGVPDRRRRLTARGRRDATAAGRWLRAHVEHLDVVRCSSAERARETWALVAAELADPPEATVDDDIYGAPPATLAALVGDLPDDAATALLVGHNPGLQELVGLLSGAERGMPPAAVAVLGWTGGWADVAPRAASLQQHVVPGD